MIELHYWPTPNGHKITMLLAEAELDYVIRGQSTFFRCRLA
jgi:GST-like protein